MHYPIKKLKYRKSLKINKRNRIKTVRSYKDHSGTSLKDKKSKINLFYNDQSIGSTKSREFSPGSNSSSSDLSSSLSISSFESEAKKELASWSESEANKELASWKVEPNSSSSSEQSDVDSNDSQQLAAASDTTHIRKGNPTSNTRVKSGNKSVLNPSTDSKNVNKQKKNNIYISTEDSNSSSDDSSSLSGPEGKYLTELYDCTNSGSKTGKTGLEVILKGVFTNKKIRKKKTPEKLQSLLSRKSRSSHQENELCAYPATLPQACEMETELFSSKNNKQIELQNEEFSSKYSKPESSKQEICELRVFKTKKKNSKNIKPINQKLETVSSLKTPIPTLNITRNVPKFKRDGKMLDSNKEKLKKEKSFKIIHPSKIISEPVSNKNSSLNILKPKVNKSERHEGKSSSRINYENSAGPVKTRKKLVKTEERNEAVMSLDNKETVAPVLIDHVKSNSITFYLPEGNQWKKRKNKFFRKKRNLKETHEEPFQTPGAEKFISVAYGKKENEDMNLFLNSGLINSRARSRRKRKNISKGSVGNTARLSGSINDQPTKMKNIVEEEKSSLDNQSNIRKIKPKIPGKTKCVKEKINTFKETPDCSNNVALEEIGTSIKKDRNDSNKSNKFSGKIKPKVNLNSKNRLSVLGSYKTEGSVSNKFETQNSMKKRTNVKPVKRKIKKAKKLCFNSKSRMKPESESPKYTIRNSSNFRRSDESKKNQRFVEVQRLEIPKWSRLPMMMHSEENLLNISSNSGRNKLFENQCLAKKTTKMYSTSSKFQVNTSSRSESFNRWKNMYSEAKPDIVPRTKRTPKKLDLERINALAKPRCYSEMKKPSQVSTSMSEMPENAGELKSLDSSRTSSKILGNKIGRDRKRIEEKKILSIAQSILLTNWNILDIKNRDKSTTTSSEPLLQFSRSSCRNTNLEGLEAYPWNDVRTLATHQTYSYGSRIP